MGSPDKAPEPVTGDATSVAERMARLLAERPRTFYELLRELPDVEYRTILIAWGTLREGRALGRDEHARYVFSGRASADRAETSP